MNKFCVNLKEHATEIINCHRKKILPLTKKEKKSCKKNKNSAKNAKKNSMKNLMKIKISQKFEINATILRNIEALRIASVI